MGLSPRVRAWFPPLLLVLGAALPLLGVLTTPGPAVAGDAAGDIWKHVWAFWHVPATIATWPHTPYLMAPTGGDHLDVMLLPALLMAPVTALLGPVAASTAWVWLSLGAVGLATWALARTLTGSEAGALVAGLAAQTAPFLLGYPLASGVYERLTVWVFPLALLGLIRIADGAWRWLPVLVLGTLFTALSCQDYGVYLALLVLVAAPPLAWPGLGRVPGWRRRALRLALTALALAGTLVLVAVMVRSVVGSPEAVAPQPGRLGLSLGVPGRHHPEFGLSDLLFPWVARARPPLATGDRLFDVVYLGWVPLLAAAVGLWRTPAARRRGLAFAVGLAALFALLSFGTAIPLGGWELPNLPFLAFACVLPYYGHVPSPCQHLGAFAPFLGVGLAAAVAAAPRHRALAGALLLAGILAERALSLPVPVVLWSSPARVSSIYDAVGHEGALVDVPRRWRGRMLSRGTAFLAQTEHHRPMLWSINLGRPRLCDISPVLDGTAAGWEEMVGWLRHEGVRWIVLHRDWIVDPTQAAETHRALEATAGPPRAQEGDVSLFDLGPLPTAEAGP